MDINLFAHIDIILILGVILVISAWSCKTTGKVGLPTLVGFILIGLLIGNWFEFPDMGAVDTFTNFALLMIVFTGGFQTNFSKAKPVLAMSTVISIGGTLLTSVLVAVFGYYVMNLGFTPSILLGVIISSTDAASVSHILHLKQVSFKKNIGSVISLESGSNEPFAHVLTYVFIAYALGYNNLWLLFFKEIIFGVLAGIIFAKIGKFLINRLDLEIDGIYGVLLCGIAFLMYGLASQFDGSGFLAVYIGGLIIGNSKLVHKGSLSKLYSAFSMLMQITLFIILGILTVPSAVMAVMGSGVLFAFILILVIRPAVMVMLMKPFRRPMNEIALVSWAGFRGAPCIVFATHLLTVELPYGEQIFSIVFLVCMLSVILQSSFVVPIAKKLKLLDE
ncbi:MAG: cation:proton antiporter [Oscillospiraceae bacterium]|jgi:cell volume regulation protein A|nr:cation:proton antiporter [Oscillospiraceae bacterium]